MNLTLSLIIFVLALCQPNANRMLAGLIYGCVGLAHWALLSWWVNDFAYYTTAGGASLLTILLIGRLRVISSTALSLIRVSLVEIVMNGVGCLLWYMYQPPLIYNLAFTLIFAWAIVVLLRKDRADEMGGDLEVGSWGDYLRLVAGAWRYGIYRDQGAHKK